MVAPEGLQVGKVWLCNGTQEETDAGSLRGESVTAK